MDMSFKLAKPGTSSLMPLTENITVIDWTKCVLCQSDGAASIRNPLKNKNKGTADSAYKKLADMLIRFHEAGCMPMEVNINFLNDGSGLANTLKKHEASWHENCKCNFAESKLLRVIKRKGNGNGATSPNSTPIMKIRRFCEPEVPNTCFFCNEPEKRDEELHEATSTHETDSRVKEGATLLLDGDILRKLSMKSMSAQNAQYHRNCLRTFYNRVRQAKQLNGKNIHREQQEGIALAYLLQYMEEERLASENVRPIFKMSDLTDLYQTRLRELGCESTVHSTRLRRRILKRCSDLEAWGSKCKQWMIAYKEDVENSLKSSYRDYDLEAFEMSRMIRKVRDDMFKRETAIDGRPRSLSNQKDSVSQSLHTLVSMILLGPGATPDMELARQQEILTIAQLISFNAVKRCRRSKQPMKFASKKDNTPLTTYIALKVHCSTRNKELIDVMYKLGLCISYDRLRNITTDIANEICSMYTDENMVCPPNLRRFLFSTAAVDNIDHNPTSNTAEGSLHGTAISIMQHPSVHNPGEPRNITTAASYSKSRRVTPLPQSYTTVPACFLSLKKYPGTNLSQEQTYSIVPVSESPHYLEEEWLQQTLQGGKRLNWAAHHSSFRRLQDKPMTIMSMLPLFYESSTSPAMMLHTMNLVKDAVNYLNPGQTPVLVGDQPLYALMKQIQKSLPETFGEDVFVVFFGGLHIELTAYRMLGHWLDGSGWVEMIIDADITSQGKAEAALKGSHIKKARHLHEVSAAALFLLRKMAYDEYLQKCEGAPLSVAEWCIKMEREQPLFHYWDLVLKIQLNILSLVRSFREGNFDLYVDSLNSLIPWFFALDHTNYSRWLSVHMQDLLTLKHRNSDVAQAFKNGAFVARKTHRSFSTIALDHAHEQLNKVLKSSGGIIGLTENQNALNKTIIAGPELGSLISSFEQDLMSKTEQDLHHHEETISYQKKFTKHLDALVFVIDAAGNPFTSSTGDLYKVDNQVVVDDSVAKTVEIIEAEGKKQYQNFIRERLMDSNGDVMAPIKCNKFPTFKNFNSKKTQSRVKAQTVALKNDCALFSRLFIACQQREGNLDEFFKHENQAFPPALCAYDQPRACNKADLIKCLLQSIEPNDLKISGPCVDVKIFDGAMLVHLLHRGLSKTFEEYIENVFVPFLKKQLENVQRIDIVWDIYNENSLKKNTRNKRGAGRRVHAKLNSPLPKDWAQYLREDKNKTELFALLGQHSIKSGSDGKEVYSTLGTDVICSVEGTDLNLISPSNHEEADTRLFLHAMHASIRGHRKLLLRATDTDIVVIAVAAFCDLSVEELWIAFGKSQSLKYIPIHQICSAIGPNKAKALPCFHAVTGCDTVSSFSGRAKKRAWETWSATPDATEGFLALANRNVAKALPSMERFVIGLYDRTSQALKVDEARKVLFTKKKRSMETIPPTSDALILHLHRAAYQGAYVWGQALEKEMDLPNPEDWGWQSTESGWQPKWTTLPLISESANIKSCSCKMSCSTRCGCHKLHLKCTALCGCDGNCQT